MPRRVAAVALAWAIATGCGEAGERLFVPPADGGPGAAATTPAVGDPFRRCETLVPGLRLPWPEGEVEWLGQLWNGDFSHKGQHAIDVRLPRGRPVLAAADGIVSQAIDEFDDVGAATDGFTYRSNYVELDHGDGRFSRYLHLERGSVGVREGDAIARGATLGRVGNSGFSTGAHLHFAVVDRFGATLPACLEGIPGGVPYRWGYRSTNRPAAPGTPPARAVAESILPADTFAVDGVILLDELPARRWPAATTIEVAARAAGPEREIRVQFRPADRHLRVSRNDSATADPRGHVALRIATPTRPGRYALLVYEDGREDVAREVPVIVRAGPGAEGRRGPSRLPRDGGFRDVDPAGRLIEEGALAGGRPTGPWRGFHPGGRPRYAGGFRDGRLDGAWAAWGADGAPLWQRTYAGGVPAGTWREYGPGGALTAIAEYARAGDEVRLHERYADGARRQEGVLRAGERDGVFTRWHPDGRVAAVTGYRAGLKHGRERAWYPDGRRRAERTWRDGTPVGVAREWYPSGRLEAESPFRAGKLDGQVRQWWPNGRRRAQVGFVAGVIEGRLIAWDEAGRVVSRGRYRAGVPISTTMIPEGDAARAFDEPGAAAAAPR